MNVKLTSAQKNKKINNPDSIAEVMQSILKRENKLGRAQEHFWVCGLNNAGKILFIELVALGRHNRVATNPPEVFRMAIYKLAVKMILIHNHPSGELRPSNADTLFTDRIVKVGEYVSIDVIEHIIISETDFFSFAQAGIIDDLKKLDTWRVVEREIPKIDPELAEKEGERKGAIKIAIKLKKNGVEESVIKKATGLSLAEIRGI